MKFVFTSKSIDEAPATFARIRFVPEDRGTKRLVREKSVRGDSTEWIEIGVGKPEEMNHRRFIILCRSVIQAAKQFKKRKIAIQFDASAKLFAHLPYTNPAEASSLAAQNFEMANLEFSKFKTRPKEGWPVVEEILICGKSSKQAEAAAKRGQLIGQEVNACRELSNTPGGHMTPKLLAKAAKDAVKGYSSVTVRTLGKTEIEKLGMGALYAVGSGSSHEPTFTIMEYKGAAGKPIVLTGKGITFDSGGLNLKPSAHIYEMHLDMSGGAAVIHTVALAAKLGLKKHVIGLIPAAENMPGNNAVRPGDIVTSLSGKTIEVIDTDAEGRLVLADALTYAKRFKPSVVIDIATLTGAVVGALGLYATGLMTRDDALAKELETHAEAAGDYVWRLPLWDEYEAMRKSNFADIANLLTDSNERYGGATHAAMFLWQFAKELDCPWAHLDIASRMTAAPGDELAKGAAGAGVQLLLSFIETWKT